MAGGMKALQKQLLQMQIDQLKAAAKPNPYLQQLMGLNQSVVNWHTNPNNTVKDIYKHPTLGGQLPVFQMARQQRDVGRMGRGIAGLGDKFNPQYAKELQLEDSTNRNIYASGMVEERLQGELGTAQQNMQNLALGQNQITTSSNPLFGSAAQLAQKLDSGGWGSFFKGILGGVVQGGMGLLTGGLSSLMGGFGGGGTPGSSGRCWVAEAVYGPDDIRTHVMRSWVNTELRETNTGRLVYEIYGLIGQQVAELAKRHSKLKRFLKVQIFDRALPHAAFAVLSRKHYGNTTL